MRSWLLVLAVAAPARADTPPDQAGTIPDATVRWEVGVGPSAGYFAEHPVYGGRLHVAGERGPFALVVTLDGYRETSTCIAGKDAPPCPPSDGHGLGYRAGGAFRLDLLQRKVLHRTRGHLGRYERLDVWVSAGAGRETISLQGLPSRSRRDGELGFGISSTNRSGFPYYTLRTLIGLAPNLGPSFVVGLDVAIGD